MNLEMHEHPNYQIPVFSVHSHYILAAISQKHENKSSATNSRLH